MNTIICQETEELFHNTKETTCHMLLTVWSTVLAMVEPTRHTGSLNWGGGIVIRESRLASASPCGRAALWLETYSLQWGHSTLPLFATHALPGSAVGQHTWTIRNFWHTQFWHSETLPPSSLRAAKAETLGVSEEKCPLELSTISTLMISISVSPVCRHPSACILSSLMVKNSPHLGHFSSAIWSVLPEHFQECVRRNEGECPHCKELFLVTELPDHTEMRCEARPRITIPPPQKRALAVPPPVSRSTCDTCSLCYETVSVSEMETHRDECLKSQIVEYKDLNTKNWQRCLSCLGRVGRGRGYGWILSGIPYGCIGYRSEVVSSGRVWPGLGYWVETIRCSVRDWYQ